MDLDDGGVDDGVFEVRFVRTGLEKPHENLRLHPIPVSLEHRVPLAEKARQIAPRTARAHDPKDRFDEQPIVAAATSRVDRLAQTMRFHLRPLGVAQNKSFHPKLEFTTSFALESRISIGPRPFGDCRRRSHLVAAEQLRHFRFQRIEAGERVLRLPGVSAGAGGGGYGRRGCWDGPGPGPPGPRALGFREFSLPDPGLPRCPCRRAGEVRDGSLLERPRRLRRMGPRAKVGRGRRVRDHDRRGHRRGRADDRAGRERQRLISRRRPGSLVRSGFSVFTGAAIRS